MMLQLKFINHKSIVVSGKEEILLLLNLRISPTIGLSTDENRYRPQDSRHMPGKRTTGHAAHISELRVFL